MVVSSLAFGQHTNGREQVSDGLWTHRGTFHIRDQNGGAFGSDGTSLVANRQILSIVNPPAISPSAFVDGHIQLQSTTGYAPRIGFHEVGSSGVALYKKVGTYELWVINNAGTEHWKIGGSRYVGAFHSPIAWKLTQSSVWQETAAQFTATFSGAPLTMFHFTAAVEGSAGACYLGIGIDGALTWPSLQVVTLNGTEVKAMSGMVPHLGMPAGSHRVALWLHGTAGAGFTAGSYADLTAVEHRG